MEGCSSGAASFWDEETFLPQSIEDGRRVETAHAPEIDRPPQYTKILFRIHAIVAIGSDRTGQPKLFPGAQERG